MHFSVNTNSQLATTINISTWMVNSECCFKVEDSSKIQYHEGRHLALFVVLLDMYTNTLAHLLILLNASNSEAKLHFYISGVELHFYVRERLL